MSEWHSIEELVEINHWKSVEAARKRIQRGHYDRKIKGGKTYYRLQGSGNPDDEPEPDTPSLTDDARYMKAKADKMEQDAETAKLKNLAEREKMILDAIDIMNRLLFDSFAEFRDIIASHTDNRGRISLTKKEFNAAADEALEAHAQKNVAELIHKFYTDTPESD